LIIISPVKSSPIEVIFPSAQAIEFAAGKEGITQLLNTVTLG
jgi:hypothetical protein